MSRINKGYNFLLQYDDHEMLYQAKLIADLLASTLYVRSAVVSYYRRMKDYSHEFTAYPTIPKKVVIYRSLTGKLTPIDFRQVVDEVEALYRNGQGTMACDLWFCTCVGYRREELLRLHFKSGQGEYARAVAVTEHKNKHDSVRLIPNSLVELTLTTKTMYPLSEQRFRAVRRHCLNRLKRFYGLRSLCITTISMALHKMVEGFGQFHRAASTTSRFYIDSTNLEYLNAAFQLPWLLPSNDPLPIKDVRLEFGTGRQPVVAPLNRHQRSDAHTPVIELVEANEMDAQSTASAETMRMMQQQNDSGMNQL